MPGTFIYLGSLGDGGGGGGGGGSAYWQDAVANAAALPVSGAVVGEARLTLDTDHIWEWDGATWVDLFASFATYVVGPAVAVDNTLPRYDGTTGKLIQGSGVTVDDTNNLATAGNLVSTAIVRGGELNATATALVGASGSAVTGAALELRSTTTALLLTRLTTAEIATLAATAVNGMIVYNITTDRFQGFFNGAWGDLHGWGS